MAATPKLCRRSGGLPQPAYGNQPRLRSLLLSARACSDFSGTSKAIKVLDRNALENAEGPDSACGSGLRKGTPQNRNKDCCHSSTFTQHAAV